MSVSTQILGYDVGGYVELYDILIGDSITGVSSDNMYLTSSIESSASITWKGNTYRHIASQSQGFSANMEGASSQPTFTVSNIDHVTFVPLIEQYEELVGVDLIRWRTFDNFLSEPGQPHIGRDEWVITQLVSMNNREVKFRLTSKMDRDDAKIPFRQVLRDTHQHAGSEYKFPGVARDGSRRR